PLRPRMGRGEGGRLACAAIGGQYRQEPQGRAVDDDGDPAVDPVGGLARPGVGDVHTGVRLARLRFLPGDLAAAHRGAVVGGESVRARYRRDVPSLVTGHRPGYGRQVRDRCGVGFTDHFLLGVGSVRGRHGHSDLGPEDGGDLVRTGVADAVGDHPGGVVAVLIEPAHVGRSRRRIMRAWLSRASGCRRSPRTRDTPPGTSSGSGPWSVPVRILWGRPGWWMPWCRVVRGCWMPGVDPAGSAVPCLGPGTGSSAWTSIRS